MNPVVVVASAVLMRVMPLVFGLAVARLAGGTDYADFVLVMSLLNVAASVFQLGVVPQVIRSRPDTDWGGFLTIAAFGTVLLFIPIAWTLFLIELVPRNNLPISVFAGGAVFGMLTGSVASALLCRAGYFLQMLKHSLAFFALSIVPVIGAVWQNSVSNIYYWASGAWIAAIGLVWLMAVSRTQWGTRPSRQDLPSMWSRFIKDALCSASFGVLMSLGIYLANRSAARIADVDVRAAVAFGFQALAIVIFVPSALSSYLVPKLRASWGQVSARRVVLQSAGSYLTLGAVTALFFVLLRPMLGQVYGISFEGVGGMAFNVLMASAVLAAANAIFNQIFVAARQFGRQLSLGALWFVSLVSGLLWFDGHAAGPGLALIFAYTILLSLCLIYVFWSGADVPSKLE